MQLIAQLLIVIIVPGLLLHLSGVNLTASTVVYSTFSNSISLIVARFVISKLVNYPTPITLISIFPVVTTVFAVAFLTNFIFRIDYSRPTILLGWAIALMLLGLTQYRRSNKHQSTFMLVSNGEISTDLLPHEHNYIKLATPSLPSEACDGVIADIEQLQTDIAWSKFLCECTLNNIPVYDYPAVTELTTGRTVITKLSSADFGRLHPDPISIYTKRCLDLLLTAIALPFTLPVLAVAAIAINLESKGPVVFKQERVGYRGRSFTIYKLRTMVNDHGDKALTRENDARITRLGKALRRYRIDELPQLLNVLRGDMSLIGPRPEQRELVKHYSSKIPFYDYRHVVRPGISGWAQINQGYVADSLRDTKTKLEYDLFYIRHLSVWLDLVILFRTVVTIVCKVEAR